MKLEIILGRVGLGGGELMAGILPASDGDKNTYRLSRHQVHEREPCGPGSSCMTGI